MSNFLIKWKLFFLNLKSYQLLMLTPLPLHLSSHSSWHFTTKENPFFFLYSPHYMKYQAVCKFLVLLWLSWLKCGTEASLCWIYSLEHSQCSSSMCGLAFTWYTLRKHRGLAVACLPVYQDVCVCTAEVIGRGAKDCPLLVTTMKCPAVWGSDLVTWQMMENMKQVIL